MSSLCLCGSEKQMSECCHLFLEGQQIPALPEQLMRSRYTAFVEQNEVYLLETWHSTTRPSRVSFDMEAEWLGLVVEAAGMHSDDEGWVKFTANYRLNDKINSLSETSRFLRQAGRWFYLNGEYHEQQPGKVGRNQACPCGSGKKYKRCCGS